MANLLSAKIGKGRRRPGKLKCTLCSAQSLAALRFLWSLCSEDPYHPSNTPIYQTSTFVQPSSSEFGPYDYTRQKLSQTLIVLCSRTWPLLTLGLLWISMDCQWLLCFFVFVVLEHSCHSNHSMFLYVMLSCCDCAQVLAIRHAQLWKNMWQWADLRDLSTLDNLDIFQHLWILFDATFVVAGCCANPI